MSNTVTEEVLDKKLDKFAVKIVHMLEPRFLVIEERLDELDRKFEHLTETLDAFLKRLDDIEADNQARDAQIARLERWIESVARKTGVKLEY